MQAPNKAASPSPGEMRKYKGVRRRKWGKWVSEIRLPNSRERIWLGSFDTPEKAARAFDAAYVCLRGPGGGGGADGLNFPSSPPPDVGRTSDPEEVCAAAASHANRTAAPAPPPNASDSGAPPMENAPPPVLVPAAALHVSVPTSDWSQFLVDCCLPPLFSPTTETWSDDAPYLLPVSSPTAAAADVDMVEESESCSFPGLWSFDPVGGPSRH
ncbi:unnamed protein product [Urochloa decumbens]|uniref:AP2/ERF domain-containing protein n=1 Tax=Urochloa decumbens TaxID=240449 RepID=A0ABC9DEN2_9POAL